MEPVSRPATDENAALAELIRETQRVAQLSSRLLHVLNCRRFQLSYRGAADDLFVVSFPKSGTTLMLMLLHQLLTNGTVAFDSINEFSPFFERDILQSHLGSVDGIRALKPPRVIKSHLPYPLVPRGPGRYIYVMRNGLDVSVSYYHQRLRSGRQFPFAPFFSQFLDGSIPAGSWFDHLRGWLANRHRLNVLYVTYEDMRRDFAGVAHRVAGFCGRTIPPSEWSRISANCSFEFMQKHEEKFDDLPMKKTETSGHGYIRRGVVGGWRDFVTPEMLTRYLSRYDRELAQVNPPRCLRGEDPSVGSGSHA